MSERPASAQETARPLQPTRALGIDVGSTNTKVVLLSIGRHGCTEVAHDAFPTPDDPGALIRGAAATIRRLLEAHAARPVAVGIASMAETGVPLDAAGSPVGSFVRWNRHGDPGRSPLVERLGREALYEATGVPPLKKAPLLVFEALRESEPERWSRLAAWAGAGDLVTRMLTGRLITDHTLAGRTLAYRLPPAGEPLAEAFDAGLLAEVGLRPDHLPAVAVPGTPAGTVTAEAAGLTGLAAGTPVFVAGHDHAVGAWGAGVREPGRRVDSVGTSEALLRVAGVPLDRRAVLAAGMSLTRTVSGDFETVLAGSPAGGSMIAALLRGELGGASLDPDDVFGAIPATPRAMVLPYPLGRQCPAPDPGARLRFVDAEGGAVDPHTLEAGELGSAVLLGLSLQLRWMRDEQERITGEHPVGALRMIGSAASGNAAWMRLRTDVLGEPLEPVTSAEPVAAAAALLAAVRAGAADAHAVLPTTRSAEPADAGLHEGVYAVFLAAATERPLTPA
ncbi:L-fuculokinase [Lysobacter korlensis]|uniref:L-fuculokinase n=1 Tax=Lysobacter korlensis TaxID=553636 RepID=A0ABV6RYZ7_9GAMM